MAGTDEKEVKKGVTTLTVDAARRRGEMFADGDRTYVRFLTEDHYEVWPLESIQARTWLARVAHSETDTWVTESTLRGICSLLDGLTRQTNTRHPVYTRCARKAGAVYLDLGTDDWTCVKVTAEGWSIIPHPPDGPFFYRPKRLQPLPIPIGNLSEDVQAADGSAEGHKEPADLGALLKPYINVADEDMRLVIACMIDALKGRGPYVVLALIGPAGSTKSSAAKAYISTFDPSRSRPKTGGEEAVAPTSLKARPRTERDFAPMVGHSHVLGMDNLSFIEDWLSDALCVVATGGDVSERALYMNFEEASMAVCNPVVLNGIESFVTRGDLTDRTVRLDVVPPEERLEEVELWRRFEKDHPAILGALLDTLSLAMAEYPAVHLERTPRMADFARWGSAVERALGWEPGSFLAVYTANREAAISEMLSGDLVASLILRYMADRPTWQGTATELLTALNETAATAFIDTRDKSFPKTPRGVTGRLQRLDAALRQFGIEMKWSDRQCDRNRMRFLTLTNRNVTAASKCAGSDGY